MKQSDSRSRTPEQETACAGTACYLHRTVPSRQQAARAYLKGEVPGVQQSYAPDARPSRQARLGGGRRDGGTPGPLAGGSALRLTEKAPPRRQTDCLRGGAFVMGKGHSAGGLTLWMTETISSVEG